MTEAVATEQTVGHSPHRRVGRLVWVPRLSGALVGIVLIVAGWGKISAPVPTEHILAWAGFAPPWPQVTTGVLPGVEIGLGLALLLGWSSRILFGSCLVLLLVFTGFLTFVAFGRYGGDCGCLGPVIDRWSGGGPIAGIARNLILLGLLVWPAVLAFRAGRTAQQSRPRVGSKPARLSSLLLAALVAGAVGARTMADPPRRWAEPWAPQFESQMRSIFSKGLVDGIANWFEMSEAQKSILEALHEEHKQRFAAFVEEHAPTRDALDEAVWKEGITEIEKFEAELEREKKLARVADRQEEVDMQFLADIQTILDAQQAERWERFRMWLNRHRWLGRLGMYLEHRIDLIVLLEHFDRRFPDEPGAVPEEVVSEYARRMDEALREMAAFQIDFSRNRMRGQMDRYRTDGEKVWLASFASNLQELERQGKKLERQHKKRLATNQRIREVNQKYTRFFEAHLPEPKAKAWRRLYRETVLHRVTRYTATPDHIKESIRGALRLDYRVRDLLENVPDLDDDQLAVIEAVMTRHDRSLQSAFKDVVAAHDARGFLVGATPQERAALEENFLESLEAIDRIQHRSIAALRNILTQAQRAAVEEIMPDLLRPAETMTEPTDAEKEKEPVGDG